MHGTLLSRFNQNEQGSAIAEFTIVAGLFFMILIGIIEFSRLLYTHNALNDAARRGARYAALHEEAQVDCVRDVIIYGQSHIEKTGQTTCGPKVGATPLVNHIESATINVTYLGANNDADADIDTDYGTNLGTVTVSIEDYDFTLMIPLLNLQLSLDAYTTTLPAESAGREPDPIGVAPAP